MAASPATHTHTCRLTAPRENRAGEITSALKTVSNYKGDLMRPKTLQVAFILGLFLSCAQAEDIQPNTVWRNDRGSDFTITDITADGVLTGTYVNRAQGFKCKNTEYPVAGKVVGDKIVFSVRWKNDTEDCASLTTWAGYLYKGRLIADWILVYSDSGLKLPFQMLGTDYFAKQMPATAAPAAKK
jgi:Avidin family